jgi:DNA-nicking Smr family endonuclease
VKKKFVASSKDRKDWMLFTKQIGNISPKEVDILEKNTEINKVQKLDLHGFSLIEANKIVKKFVIESFNSGCKKLLIVTGKGLRSKSHNNPYLSKKLSVLKYSVPEYIKNDQYLSNKISSISTADIKDGGEGAIYILLKNKKNFTK